MVFFHIADDFIIDGYICRSGGIMERNKWLFFLLLLDCRWLCFCLPHRQQNWGLVKISPAYLTVNQISSQSDITRMVSALAIALPQVTLYEMSVLASALRLHGTRSTTILPMIFHAIIISYLQSINVNSTIGVAIFHQ